MDNIIINFISGTISSIFGAFVGFGLALYLQRKTDKAVKLDKHKKVIKSITQELLDISQSLQGYIAVNQVYKQKITIPAWDAILNSGFILELIDYPLYDNLIHVYSLIKSFNESQNCSTNEVFQKSMNDIINASNEILSNS